MAISDVFRMTSPVRTSIGAALAITNPISTGYYAVLAAAEAFLRVVDELIIVDGGCTDDSIERILSHVDNDSRVRVVSDENVGWGAGDAWHWGQLCVNLNRGLDELSTDWGWSFSADYVLADDFSARDLRAALDSHADALWVSTWRGKPLDGAILHHMDARNMVFNLRLRREGKQRVGYGLAPSGHFSDWPILFEEYAEFSEPRGGTRRTIYSGREIRAAGHVDVEFIAYGHFFYTLDQVDSKILRWDRAVSRFTGDAPARLGELRLRHGVHSIVGFDDIEEVLSWGHPPEMERVIREYYRPGMMGGAIRRTGRFRARGVAVALQAYRVERKVRTLARRAIGVKGERAELEWRSLE